MRCGIPAPRSAIATHMIMRAVQDMVGHQDPKTTARYARVVDCAQTNPVLKVPIDL